MPKLMSIERGTSVLAFFTSSDICKSQSYSAVESDKTYVHNGIRADEGQCVALQSDKKG